MYIHVCLYIINMYYVGFLCVVGVFNSRADFLLKLQEKLGNGFERFDALDMYVAPPMRMGVWSMARVLRQRIEYYYAGFLCRKLKQLIAVSQCLDIQLGQMVMCVYVCVCVCVCVCT